MAYHTSNTYHTRGCGGRVHMVVGFTITYAISAYHHYVIKFVSDLQQVSGFLQVLQGHPPIKLIATL